MDANQNFEKQEYKISEMSDAQNTQKEKLTNYSAIVLNYKPLIADNEKDVEKVQK